MNERRARLATFLEYIRDVTPEAELRSSDLPTQTEVTGAIIVAVFHRAHWDIDGSHGKTRHISPNGPGVAIPQSIIVTRPYWTTDEAAFFTKEDPVLDSISDDPGDLIDWLNLVDYRTNEEGV